MYALRKFTGYGGYRGEPANKRNGRECAQCLYRIGWGKKRLAKHFRTATSTMGDWIKPYVIKDADLLMQRRMTGLRHAQAIKPKSVKIPKTPIAKVERIRLTAEQKAERERIRAKSYYHRNAKAIYERQKANKQAIIKARIRTRIYNALIDGTDQYKRTARTHELIGCTITELMDHLSKQFTEGMTWDNYGEWHIDHKRPCASYDLTQAEQQKACFHHSNLQPMWAKDNRRKWSYWDGKMHRNKHNKIIHGN